MLLVSSVTSLCHAHVQDIKKAGFSIAECVNVEIMGPVTAHHALYALPFTQGSITAINNDPKTGYTWDVQVSDDSFPLL